MARALPGPRLAPLRPPEDIRLSGGSPPAMMAYFGEMAWETVGESLGDLEYTLRYGEPTQNDLMYAAGVVHSYRALVMSPKRKRDYVVRMLRRALALIAPRAEEDE